MRASEERTLDRRRADTARLNAAAQALRHAAIQTGYAGLRGTYVGITLSSLLEGVARSLELMPNDVRRDVLRAARALLDGPDGPPDPRTASTSALSDGPGH